MHLMSKKILLIDDSRFSRNMVKRALGGGYHFLEAENGMAGIELFVNDKPDLVILDLTMPEMPGIEVLGMLRKLNPSVPILIMSADTQSFTRTEAADLGATGYLTKPISPEILQTQVTAHLASDSGTAQTPDCDA